MKALLKTKLAGYPTPEEQFQYLREYLQELILKLIEKHGSMAGLAFVGGTALRILYDLPRFSEDLDFSQVQKAPFDFENFLRFIKRELLLYGFTVNMTQKETGNVKNSFIKFEDLLFPLGLSPHKKQILSVKIEIDSNPPTGYALQTTTIKKSFLTEIQHFDKSSLFAGKCHALLCRPYPKGRDFFDLLWFIGQKVTPNYTLLSHAYEQTQKERKTFSAKSLKRALIEKISTVNFNKVAADVQPFLVAQEDLRYFNTQTFLSAIESWELQSD